MKKRISMLEFEDEIRQHVSFEVVQSDPIEHIFLFATFSAVHVLPSKRCTLLFKNDSCEVHIHNITDIAKRIAGNVVVYDLRCAELTSPGHERSHVCSVICH